MLNYKPTAWKKLSMHDCEILKIVRNSETGYVSYVRIKHPEMKRPRNFVESLSGNLYSRYTGAREDVNCIGYIIKNWQELISDKKDERE